MNSQIASQAASGRGSQPGSTGVGFAVSSDTVAQAIKAIEAGKGVSSGSPGVMQARSAQPEGEGGGQSPFGAGKGGEGSEDRIVIVP